MNEKARIVNLELPNEAMEYLAEDSVGTENQFMASRQKPWFQFSLRAFMVFVALAAVVFGFVGRKVHFAKRQQAVVAAIRNDGGYVLLRYPWINKVNGIPVSGPLGRGVANFGPFGSWVSGGKRPLISAWTLGNIKNYQSPLEPTSRSATCLRLVVGDDLFRHLYCNVRGIFVEGKQVTDQTLAEMAHLRQAQYFWLYLGKTSITDAGLAHLGGLGELSSLYVTDAAITDAGLRHLTRMDKLHTLVLSGTKITDAGVETLSQLAQLKRLDLRNTTVTPAGIAKLQKMLPECVIAY